MTGNRDTATARDLHVDPVQRSLELEGKPERTATRGEKAATNAIATARGVPASPVPAPARYRGLLRRAPAVVCELAPDGTTLFANETVRRVTGYSPDELKGENWWELFYPGELHGQVDELNRRFRAGEVTDHEMVLRAKDGTLKTLAWGFSKNREEGAVKSVLGFGVDLTEHKRLGDELKQSVAKLRGALEGTIEAMAMTVEVRDPYTAGHQRRVATLAGAIAEELGLTEEQIAAISLAGKIHDIGKISIPTEVLAKRGPMTQSEIGLLKAHPQVGYAILRMIEFPWPIAQIVYQHHERYNGSGYPLGLSRGRILIEARILSVADVVESMAGPRPYRAALGIDEAVREITEQRGTLFDPEVVDACLEVLGETTFEWE